MKLVSLLAAFLLVAPLFAEPPPPARTSVPLFDGMTLAGWEGDGALWRVQDGALTGGSLTETVKHNDFLATVENYENFIVRLKIKLTGSEGFVNSGFQIRSQRVPSNSEMAGYQCDFGDPNWWGAIYDESRRNKVLAPSDMKALEPVLRRSDWNDYVIRADGPRITTWINGVQATDYTEPDASIPRKGKLGIQIHGGGKALVQVKEITIEELPTTAGGAKPAAAAPGDKGPAGAKTPQEELVTFKLPDGFEAELVAAEDPAQGIGKFVPIAFDQRGALWTTTALEYPVDGNENPGAADALYASRAKDKVLVYDRDSRQPTGYSPKPRIFAEGLAIPLGVLPYKSGCYVQHGHDIAFLEDTDADGRADKRTVILTGFGVQDSHLFPHQFMRAPGGWIWMAQGAFNYSKVRRPDEPAEKAVKFDQTRMAKFRPDGSSFDITSNGPCNIWGLVLNGEGEAFIQEANDFGYPVMPFHEYANYPGCSDAQWKSYAPEFPGTAPDFRMGGTGLSGLALLDDGWARVLDRGKGVDATTQTVLVANPITNRIQGIKMHRDGPRWKLDKPTDFLVSTDEWFRPVAITIGPDGCLYIVDWYNQIISHNEVPRNHPDRDKTRGRIWRVKAKAVKPFEVPDFTRLSGDELIAKLGGESLAQSHLAWQALTDSGLADELSPRLETIIRDKSTTAARRIQAQWALEEHDQDPDLRTFMAKDANLNVRREALRSASVDIQWAIYEVAHDEGFKHLANDPDPTVRAELIRKLGRYFDQEGGDEQLAIRLLLSMGRAPLAGPTAASTQNGKKTIKVGEAYDREFERYLVRLLIERQLEGNQPPVPGQLPVAAKFLAVLDSLSDAELPVENRLLATLALEPKASVARVAKLLPQLQRAPGQEEVLRLAQFPGEPGVGEALKATLANPSTRTATLEALLAVRTKLDGARLTPFLGEAATALLSSEDPASFDLGVKLAAGFKLTSAEPALVALLSRVGWASRPPSVASRGAGFQAIPDVSAGSAVRSPETLKVAGGTPIVTGIIRALAEIGSPQTELFAELARTSHDPLVRDEALAALAASRVPDAAVKVLALYSKLPPAARRTALDRLSATKPGAVAIVSALGTDTIAKADLDAATLDRLQAVLGPDDPALAKLVDHLGALFRPALALDGSEAAWTQTNVTLEGPCTIEAWVRLDPQGRKIGNADSVAGAPGQLDFNFFDERARIYAFPPLNDVAVAKKPIARGLWTHVAATRDAGGIWRLFMDGELDATGAKPAPGRIENIRLAWNGAKGGTQGTFGEVRLWCRERTADEIRAASDRSLPAVTPGLVFTSATGDWGKPQAGAKTVKTSDFAPMLMQEEGVALDAKYARNRALAAQPGDLARGKIAATLCQACHLMGATGGNIGPNLSGVGAMGTEAILRNILQPNAAMENGFRTYRVELKDGDLVDALFVSEDKDAIIVRMPGAEDRRIPRTAIRETKYLRRSLMPEGLLDAMPAEQVSDLFAYLRMLK